MFSNLLKFILGFLLAIAVLIGSGVTVAFYFMNRTSIPPTKPVFANDHPLPKTQKPKVVKAQAKPQPAPETETTPSPSPTPTESPNKLPPGAYLGRVTWPQGLRLRTAPDKDAETVGGVAANQKVIIVEESQDKTWQKIRIEGTTQEGWVKAANIERVDQ